MRKITRLAANAFRYGKSFSGDNTLVKVTGERIELFLHGNLISWKDLTGFYVTDAGWQTMTTKERLNGVLEVIGKKIHQKNGTWFFQDDTVFPYNQIIKVCDNCLKL